MDFKGFYAALKNDKIERVYLFSGQEEYVKSSALKELRTKILMPGFEDMNETILDNAPVDAIIASCETLPMLGERRLVVVRDSALLLSGRAKDEAAEVEKLASYLPQAPESCCLVFYCSGNIDKRKKLSQEIKKTACMVDFSPLDDANLSKWIRSTLRSKGKSISPQDIELLIFTSGRDLLLLSGELEKLSNFAGERQQITKDDIESVATRTSECSVFTMIDALIAGKREQAFQLLTYLMEEGEARIGILAMITRQYRQLMHVKLMEDERVPQAEQMKRIGISSYIYRRIAAQARMFNSSQLKAYVDLCVDMDYAIKSGRIREDAALDRTMLMLCLKQ